MDLVYSYCIVLLPVAIINLTFLLPVLSGVLLEDTMDLPTYLLLYMIICFSKDLWVYILLDELPSGAVVVFLFTLFQLWPLWAVRVCVGILCQPSHLLLSTFLLGGTALCPKPT